MTDVLNVYLKNKFAGCLSYSNGELSFQYDKNYLANNNNFPLSASLPLSESIFNDNVVRPFFDGLLPEDVARTQIARILKTDSRNTFALLKSIGAIAPEQSPYNLKMLNYKICQIQNTNTSKTKKHTIFLAH
jgi:serine/threonine-protein kinase HipA